MNILETIVAQKRLEVAELPPRSVTAQDLQAALEKRGERHDFEAALRKPRSGKMGLIAEIKKASPSAGMICENFDAVRIAKEYESAGADCISVLTDKKFFQGSLADLKAVRSAVKLPLLRKDFIIDERQILEAVEAGADAILLIAGILSFRQLKHFYGLAAEAGIAALVEVHNIAEMEFALMVGASIIGVNNRDLKSFTVDLATTENLSTKLGTAPGGQNIILVSESGIHSSSDAVRLADCGTQAILVGETLMRAKDVAAKVRELTEL